LAIAPAMTQDKTIPEGGILAFQALNAEPTFSEGKYSRGYESPINQRWTVGDGNVEAATERQLRGVWHKTQELREGSDDIHDAVYVVGPLNPPCIKVGMATDPIARLAQLQTGNPEKLYLHRVFWTLKPDAARNLEAVAHSFLGKKSKRLVGEWFECSASVAHDTIINACRSLVLGFVAITPHWISEVKVEKIM
jgi:hypothetical protein